MDIHFYFSIVFMMEIFSALVHNGIRAGRRGCHLRPTRIGEALALSI